MGRIIQKGKESMLLFTETTFDNSWEVKAIIQEGLSDQPKNYFIEGIVMQSEIKNKNGRVYPKATLLKECTRYINEMVEKNRAMGELGHPSGPSVNLDRVSHMFKELSVDGNNFYGRAKILDTPFGKIVKNLIDEGAVLGCSSRALGTLKKHGDIMEVQDDLTIAAIDIVADPSAPNSFVQGIMEGREWILESNGIFVEKSKKLIENAHKKELEKLGIQLLEEFLRKL